MSFYFGMHVFYCYADDRDAGVLMLARDIEQAEELAVRHFRDVDVVVRYKTSWPGARNAGLLPDVRPVPKGAPWWRKAAV